MRKDGRHEAKYTDPATGLRRSTYSRISQEDADEQARRLGTRKGDDSYGWYYVNVYLPTIAVRKFSWRRQVAWAHDSHILPEFDTTPLSELTRERLQRFYNRLASKLGATSVGHVRRIQGQVLRLAEDDGLIQKNPCPKVRIQPASPKKPHSFSAQELYTLYEHSHDLVKPLVFLCGFCGLRQGEALATTWGHIEDGCLKVKDQIQLQGKEIVTTTTKTKAGVRSIPLPEDMLSELQQFRGGMYLCRDSKGGVLRPKNVRRELNLAQAKAGLKLTGSHSLRHSFVTGLRADLECPDHIVKDLIGHSRGETIDRYTKSAKGRMLHWMGVWWGTCVHMADDTKLSSKEVK